MTWTTRIAITNETTQGSKEFRRQIQPITRAEIKGSSTASEKVFLMITYHPFPDQPLYMLYSVALTSKRVKLMAHDTCA